MYCDPEVSAEGQDNDECWSECSEMTHDLFELTDLETQDGQLKKICS